MKPGGGVPPAPSPDDEGASVPSSDSPQGAGGGTGVEESQRQCPPPILSDRDGKASDWLERARVNAIFRHMTDPEQFNQRLLPRIRIKGDA